MNSFTKLVSVIITNSVFMRSRGILASILNIPAESFSRLEVRKSQLIGNQMRSKVSEDLIKLNKDGLHQFTQPSMFRAVGMPSMTFINCEVYEQKFSVAGAFMDMYLGSNMTIINSKFSDMSAF